MPDFIVIKSEGCTSDQESDITVALIWNGGVTSVLTLGSVAALMTGTDADLETATSFLGNGLMQVVTSADEFLPADYGQDAFELMLAARNLLDPGLADALANPPGAGGQWEFGGECSEGTR
ncbi:hypothetical protein [Pseudonocardia alni]|uniref:hypothetical protein n=1 Tax=Pseudonocardia alni TaxID=33907 RepID=UPI003322C50D